MIKIFQNTNYDFIGKRRITLIACLAVLAFSILPGVVNLAAGRGFFNWGVDFAGGILTQVRFTQPTDEAALRDIIEPIAPGSQISRFGQENEFLIRAPLLGENTTAAVEQIRQALREQYNDSFVIDRTEAVGPKVGSELQTRAIIAVLLSFAATLIYLAFRLEWTFGFAGIVATIVDLLFTVGVLAALRLEFSLTTIAALLTIIGYSLNDKIVIFDRIRENMRASRQRGEFAALVNRSINETIPRTVMTGGSVMAVLLVLFLLGGVAISDFALIMFLGVVAGTISSMFVAPTVLLWVRDRVGKNKTKETTTRPARVAV